MITLILGLLLGAIGFILTNFNKSESKNLIDFIKLKENYLAAILNIVFGVIIIFSWISNPETLLFMGISELTFINCALLGFTAHGIFTGATEAQSKNVKTKLGSNK